MKYRIIQETEEDKDAYLIQGRKQYSEDIVENYNHEFILRQTEMLLVEK
jgi:hypothetical protein